MCSHESINSPVCVHTNRAKKTRQRAETLKKSLRIYQNLPENYTQLLTLPYNNFVERNSMFSSHYSVILYSFLISALFRTYLSPLNIWSKDLSAHINTLATGLPDDVRV